ncbi:MAG: electron transfer flavoprotein subunit beta/FixA family protein [Nitrospinales bacterium]
MKIIVCVKQVLDTAAKIRIKDGKVETEGIPRILNPYDEYAVEEAIRIKEKRADTEVALISVGPESFRDVLRTGLAMGADRATLLMDDAFAGLDNFGIAQVLAKAIQSMSYDLILCGRQAVDDDMAQVGPALAVTLKIPYISVVTRLTLAEDGKQAEVTRQIEGGSEILEAPLPLALTCQKGLNEPRLPSLKGIIAAKKKPVETLDAQAIGFDPAAVGAESVRIKASALSLPPERGKGIMLEGSAQESAARLVKILREEIKVI